MTYFWLYLQSDHKQTHQEMTWSLGGCQHLVALRRRLKYSCSGLIFPTRKLHPSFLSMNQTVKINNWSSNIYFLLLLPVTILWTVLSKYKPRTSSIIWAQGRIATQLSYYPSENWEVSKKLSWSQGEEKLVKLLVPDHRELILTSDSPNRLPPWRFLPNREQYQNAVLGKSI